MAEGVHAAGAQYVLVDLTDSSRLFLIGFSPISTPHSQGTTMQLPCHAPAHGKVMVFISHQWQTDER